MPHVAKLLGTAGAMLAAWPAVADPSPVRTAIVEQSTAGKFALAREAQARGDLGKAEEIWETLAQDPARTIRNEARFRQGMMLAGLERFSEAALLFRAILDEEPDAQRVRLELARVLDAMGDEAGARRALREAQAGGLPPDVARLVDRYAAALRAQQPFGVSLDLALAPDSNINRATRSNTLGTVIGDFELDENARQRSGIGAAIRAQAFVRGHIDDRVSVLARAAGSADLYRDGAFNDVGLAASAGPEFRLGDDRLAVEGGASWRWFGGEPYSTTATFAATWLHPIGRQSQLRTTITLGSIDNLRNDLQDGRSYSLAFSYEHALSARAGVGASLAADRQHLRDPGYANASGQFGLFGYREFGSVTVVGTLSYSRLEADARLLLFPKRRVDDLFRTSLAFTWRRVRLGNFAPLVRLTAERNRSTIALYDYRRLRTEFGVSRAF